MNSITFLSNKKSKAYLSGFFISGQKDNEYSIELYENIINIFNIAGICRKKHLGLLFDDNNNSEYINQETEYNNIVKSNCLSFDEIKNDELKWDYIRGIFDKYGRIMHNNNNDFSYSTLEINMNYVSENICKKIIEFFQIPCSSKNKIIRFSFYNAIDFLHNIYKDKLNNYNENKFKEYIKLLEIEKKNLITLNVIKRDKNAIIPEIKRITDAEIDLYVIKLIKEENGIEYYDTGLTIIPQDGFYLELYARSSTAKKGYILSNSVGIIDSTYMGNIIVPLIKINKNAPKLQLPDKIVQIIPKKNIFVSINELKRINGFKTSRNDGGFGSTGHSIK